MLTGFTLQTATRVLDATRQVEAQTKTALPMTRRQIYDSGGGGAGSTPVETQWTNIYIGIATQNIPAGGGGLVTFHNWEDGSARARTETCLFNWVIGGDEPIPAGAQVLVGEKRENDGTQITYRIIGAPCPPPDPLPPSGGVS